MDIHLGQTVWIAHHDINWADGPHRVLSLAEGMAGVGIQFGSRTEGEPQRIATKDLHASLEDAERALKLRKENILPEQQEKEKEKEKEKATGREELREGRDHLTVTGTFQSDKYPWCPAGFVPLKISDPLARDFLKIYALRRGHIDKEFERDLMEALKLTPAKKSKELATQQEAN